jgi:hypothetical protein
MAEIHAIRARHYEETKHMTYEERVAKIHKDAEEIIRKYGFTFNRVREVVKR